MRDTSAQSMVSQVETQTPEGMAKKFVSDCSARTPPHMRSWKVGTTKATTQTATPQDEISTVKKLLRDSRVDFQATAKVQKVEMSPLSRRPQEPSNFLILHHSLVRDRVPQGFEEAFSGLEQAAHLAADRQDITASRVSNLQSSGWIFKRNEQAAQLTQLEKTATDQFLLAADKAPRRFRAKFQQSLFQGPNARKEAEETERTKWIELLGSMLAHTPTPMGTLLAAQPSNLQLLGAGRRAATLRSRVRPVKRFLHWLAVSHAKGCPTELHDYTGYLQARQSEPCTQGALEGAHKALVFMEEVAGVTAQTRFSTSSLYLVIQKQLLANSIPGRPTKQAPRMFMLMLAAHEELTVDDKSLPYYRVYAWWILLQSWGTMRFGDHRGPKPSDVQVTGNTMSAKLTRCPKRQVIFRMVHISTCCCLVSPSWLSSGWTLLKSISDFPRDFLLPAPASNCNGCLRKELRYDIGSAMQNRVLSSLQFNGQSSLTRSTASFWTPHSARSFLPSATAALGVPKDQRDYLGGWSAQRSDSYTRVAARMITNLQKLVIRARQGSSEHPFAEAETSKQLDDHLCSKGYSAEHRARCFKGS